MNPRSIHALLLLAFGLVCSAAGQPGSTPLSASAPPTTASGASTRAAPADIFNAVARSDLEGIAALLSANPQLFFATNSDGQTPLHVAAFDRGIRRTILGAPIPEPKCLDMVRLLVAGKADVNARDNSGQTPLHRAAFCGRADVMAFLLANKAEVNAKDTSGVTPLHLATRYIGKEPGPYPTNFLEMTKLLLSNKVDVNPRDNRGVTPLHNAVMGVREDLMELLVASGADVNARSADGTTPLHLAAWGGNRSARNLRYRRIP